MLSYTVFNVEEALRLVAHCPAWDQWCNHAGFGWAEGRPTKGGQRAVESASRLRSTGFLALATCFLTGAMASTSNLPPFRRPVIVTLLPAIFSNKCLSPSTRAKWRSSLSACRSVLERPLTPRTIVRDGDLAPTEKFPDIQQ